MIISYLFAVAVVESFLHAIYISCSALIYCLLYFYTFRLMQVFNLSLQYQLYQLIRFTMTCIPLVVLAYHLDHMQQTNKKTDFTVFLLWWGLLRLAPVLSKAHRHPNQWYYFTVLIIYKLLCCLSCIDMTSTDIRKQNFYKISQLTY